jgi:hypothetical protein
MRVELNTDQDVREVDFRFGTTCAACKRPIDGLPALWIARDSLDFYLHKHCEPEFKPDTVKKYVGDIVLLMQDETLHDTPPERN